MKDIEFWALDFGLWPCPEILKNDLELAKAKVKTDNIDINSKYSIVEINFISSWVELNKDTVEWN